MPPRLPPDPCSLRRPPRSRDGFTLVEMMVVTLIIATLASLLLAAASGVFERSRKVQAKNDLIQIVTAINAFYAEYGQYPTSDTSDTVAIGGASAVTNAALFNTLRAKSTALNTKSVVFLTPSYAKTAAGIPKGGISQTANSIDQYFDPWGSPYSVLIDGDYNNSITNPYSDVDGSAGPPSLSFGVVAFSLGKNGRLGGGASLNSSFSSEAGSANIYKNSSDVLSW